MNHNFCLVLSVFFLYSLAHVYDPMKYPKLFQEDGAIKRTIYTTLSNEEERNYYDVTGSLVPD